MTVTAPIEAAAPGPTITALVARPPRASPPSAAVPQASGRRLTVTIVAWLLVALTTIGIVLFALTPSFQEREQAELFSRYRVELQQAANESLTIAGATTPSRAPEPGAPVAVLEVGGLQLQQVAVEGATSSQTSIGPAHVPGTAGLGQPGNAVVVGRRGAYGGPFGAIAQLHHGDQIVVTTRQGQAVYVVDSVGEHTIDEQAAATGAANGDLYATGAAPADPLSSDVVRADDLYGPTKDDRLTLLTSADVSPLNATRGVVVIATMQGRPFPPTPQGGRTNAQSGRAGDGGALAGLLLALLFYSTTIGATVVLYRRSSARVAYLLTAAPLLVGTILVAEAACRLLPAWL